MLKPSVEKLENTLKGNLNEIKIHLKGIEREKKLNKNNDNPKNDKKEINKKTDVYKNQLVNQEKGETLSEVIDKLADKLNTKERILKQMEREKEKYMNTTNKNQKYIINTCTNTFTDSISDL